MALLAGKYELGRAIGAGGMAEVFEGAVRGAEGFRRPVAIKRIHGDLAADPAFRRRFVDEAVLSAELDHPNIVSVLDFGFEGGARGERGRPFLVMERVRGLDLRALLRAGPVAVDLACHIAREMLRALRYAHALAAGPRRRGVLHRDVSPHNVLLSREGAVHLTDFGIAKALGASGASVSGRLRGKLGYMSPEQARGERLDARSDLFSVGVVFYELLTGRALFCGDSLQEAMQSLLFRPIPPPSASRPGVPADVDELARALLARDRAARPQCAAAAQAALRDAGVLAPAGMDAAAELVRARERAGEVAEAAAPAPGARPGADGDGTPETRALGRVGPRAGALGAREARTLSASDRAGGAARRPGAARPAPRRGLAAAVASALGGRWLEAEGRPRHEGGADGRS